MRKFGWLALVMLTAVTAAAQMGGMEPRIAPDGTILVMRPSITAEYRMQNEVIAVSRNGATLWKWEGSPTMHSLAVSPSRVFVAGARSATMMPGPTPTFKDEIVALSLSTGAVQWRQEISGAVSAMEVSGDRIYVITGTMSGMTVPGMPMTGRVMRTPMEMILIAVDAGTGAILWTASLK